MSENLDHRTVTEHSQSVKPDNDKQSESKIPQKESIPRLFGQNVRKYRKARGLTQEQLSERLGVSQKHLSIIETGIQFASASLIERLCEELSVAPADLFGGSRDEVIEEIKKTRGMIMSLMMNELSHNFAGIDSTLNKIKRMLEQKENPSSDEFPFPFP